MSLQDRLFIDQWDRRLCQSKVDHSWHGMAVDFHHQNIGWFEVTMDDGFLMRVLYAFARTNEELKPLWNRQLHWRRNSP